MCRSIGIYSLVSRLSLKLIQYISSQNYMYKTCMNTICVKMEMRCRCDCQFHKNTEQRYQGLLYCIALCRLEVHRRLHAIRIILLVVNKVQNLAKRKGRPLKLNGNGNMDEIIDCIKL